MSEPLVDDDFCISFVEDREEVLRDACARLRLLIRVWITFQPAGIHTEGDETWVIQDWTPERKAEFKTKFVSTIHDGFGNGRIWILHTEQGTRDVWCDVRVALAEDDFPDRDEDYRRANSHLCVKAINDPTPFDDKTGGFRSHCQRGGDSAGLFDWKNPIDMTISYGNVVGPVYRLKKVSDSTSDFVFEQNVLLHEFGHYLGLKHFCESAGEPNQKEQYCYNKTTWEQDDLMADGNSLRKHHVWPFIARLRKHEYADGAIMFPWIATDRMKRPWIGDPDFEDGISWQEMLNGMIGKDG